MPNDPTPPRDTQPDPMTATAILADIRAGRRSPAEVADEALALATALEPELHAFAHLDPALVRAQAAAIDPAAPLAGVTIAVKDVIATADMPTAHNTARYRGSRPGVDAACVDTLRQAGAVIFGKTVTTEFASTRRGAETRNPRDTARTPGGSSSGSAAAVASGMCAIGIGTQTGGSTIRPASFCGIYGWKPTWGAVSREGAKLYSLTCDTIGFYARTTEDLDLLADLYDLDPAPAPVSLNGLRIGLCRGPNWGRTEPSMRAALSEAATRLRVEGAEIVDLTLPPSFDNLPAAHGAILAREGRAAFLNELRATPELHDEYHAIVGNRRGLTATEMRAAYALADGCRAALDEILSGLDAIMTPSACGEAPLGLEDTGDAAMNSLWTLMQVPVVSAPGLTGPSGMPLGISFVTRRYADRTAIAIARAAGAVFQLETAFA